MAAIQFLDMILDAKTEYVTRGHNFKVSLFGIWLDLDLIEMGVRVN